MRICCLVNPNSGKKKGLQIFKSIKLILDEKKIIARVLAHNTTPICLRGLTYRKKN